MCVCVFVCRLMLQFIRSSVVLGAGLWDAECAHAHVRQFSCNGLGVLVQYVVRVPGCSGSFFFGSNWVFVWYSFGARAFLWYTSTVSLVYAGALGTEGGWYCHVLGPVGKKQVVLFMKNYHNYVLSLMHQQGWCKLTEHGLLLH